MAFGTSIYTKQNHGQTSSVTTGAKSITELANITQPRQIKNIRGWFVVGDSVVSPTLAKGGGYIFLLKWPKGETVTAGAIDSQDPRVLHPVPYAFFNYPQTLYYDFRGINLTEHDSLYFGVQNANGGGTHDFAWQFLFAMRVHPPTG